MDLRFRNSYQSNQPRKAEVVVGIGNSGSKAGQSFSTPIKDSGTFCSKSTYGYGSNETSFSSAQPRPSNRPQIDQPETDPYRYPSSTSTAPPKPQNPYPYTSAYPSPNQPAPKPDSYAPSSTSFTQNKSFYNNDMPTNYKQNLTTNLNEKKRTSDGHTLSWTKYIAMEFKNQELENQVALQLGELKFRAEKIEELSRIIYGDRKRYELDLQNLQRKFQKQIADQKKGYEIELDKKNAQINDLIVKLTDETKQCLAQQIKDYLTQILTKTGQIELELKAEQQKKELLQQTLSKFEQSQQLNEEDRLTRTETLQKLGQDISSITTKILYQRSTYTPESTNLLQVIQAQSLQITQLRNNFEELQQEYLKLRSLSVEMTNKLNNYQREQKLTEIRNKSEANGLLVELGFKLTTKQNQSNSLKRKLTTLERKYKSLFEEHKSKLNNIENALTVRTNQNMDVSSIKAALASLKLQNHCEMCLANGQELEQAREKLRLFVN